MPWSVKPKNELGKKELTTVVKREDHFGAEDNTVEEGWNGLSSGPLAFLPLLAALSMRIGFDKDVPKLKKIQAMQTLLKTGILRVRQHNPRSAGYIIKG